MNEICLMKNTIRNYAWGSRTAIAGLLGKPGPSHHPEAELWMGAHPSAPSLIWYQGRWQGLDLLVKQYPVELLGRATIKRFNGMLPFLLKVLAADQPLSIQAHPDSAQARAGFLRENELDIALDAPHRNYKDDQHKPECLCALTPFLAMCGFRTIAEMMSLLGPLWPSEFNSALTLLTRDGLKSFFRYLMTLETKPRTALVAGVVRKNAEMKHHGEVSTWIDRLAQSFGTDIGVLSPILLNLVGLNPGEAIYLPSGQMHAYLDGVGIELMANSDNVLRGGLTPKHVDVPELLDVLDFSPRKPRLLDVEANPPAEQTYPSRSEEFILSRIQIAPSAPYHRPEELSKPEILLCTDGDARFHWQDGAGNLDLKKGNSAFVPANMKTYSIDGHATLYRAKVNL